MNDKPTYEELENQIAELKKQNEILQLNSIFQNEEKGKRAAELIIANKELDFQNEEKRKRKAKLIIAEHKIEESNEKYRISEIDLKKAQQIAHLGNWVLNIETKELFWSDEIYRIFDCEPHDFEATYEAFLEFIHPDDREKVNSAYLKSLETKTEYQIEHRLVTKNNQIKYVKEKCKTSFNEQGKPLNSFGIVIDITEQKELEFELIKAKEHAEESKQLFKSLIENAPDGVVILDKSGKFKYGSPNAIRHFGYSEKDFIGHLGEEFAHPDDMPLISKTFETIFTNPELKPKIKYRFKRKNGEFRWLETTFNNLLSDKYINGIVLNFSDITERKQIEIELLKSKEHFKAIFEQASAGIAIALPNGKIVNSNSKFAEMLGYSIDELLTLTSFDITFPEDIQKELLLVNQVLDSKLDTFYIEKKYIHKNGHIVWAYLSSNVVKDENGNIIFVIGVAIDISERKIIENELIVAKEKAEESEERIQSVFSVAPTGIGLIKERIIWEVNPKICEMTGYTSEELIGKSALILYPSQNEFDLVGREKYSQINEKGTGIVETKWKRKNGSIIDIILASTPLDLSDYKKGITFTALDITERKRIEIELLIAKEKAEQSDRLKSTFLQNMSHEVRTPLNAIVGFSQLMTKPNQSPEKLKKFTEIITESSEKLIGIVTDVIEISQIHTNQANVKLSTKNCNLLISEKIKDYFTNKAKGKNILLEFAENCPCTNNQICTDFEKLDRIINHLIDNAIKFTIKGSIKISCCLKKNYLQVTITDTGIGISQEMQKVIFEPFRQVETGMTRNFGGNGLGLALVKSYVELLNGSITLQSELNKGTAITIGLPMIENTNEIPIKNNQQKKYFVNTILIAEDEFANFEYLKELLSDTGIEILHATNGQQAIDLCRNSRKIDLVLMDIKMPIMNGDTATKMIKEFRPELPIIAQTAYALESERTGFIGIFDDYLTKPISEKALMEKLKLHIKD